MVVFFKKKVGVFRLKNIRINAGLQNYLEKMLFYDRCTTLYHVYAAVVL